MKQKNKLLLRKMQKNTKFQSPKKNNKNDNCKDLTFEECELAILRMAVDKAEETQGQKLVNSPEIKKIIEVVENFIIKNELICYGGTAINNLLPRQSQFYNKDVEIPDYDFYSYDALENAIKLTDIYYNLGFQETEAKSGQHYGTYKVFVNFIPIADITQIDRKLFMAIKKEAIKVAGIYYAPPNFLKMAMYLELSRPNGDVSRWEKVLKRLILLNKTYPINKGVNCDNVHFLQKMSFNLDKKNLIYDTTLSCLIDQDVVFFGGYALYHYSKYMPNKIQEKIDKNPDFDVLSETPLKTANIVQERLIDVGIKNVNIYKRTNVGEIIAEHYEIKVGRDTIAFIYEPMACHSFNIVYYKGNKIKIATIDTMLSFYLAFLYADRKYYNKNRILCMSNYLFLLQQKNRLEQKGLLKRFSISCIGHQQTIEEIRSIKTQKFNELKEHKEGIEYKRWFLRYRPYELLQNIQKTKTTKYNEETKTQTTQTTKTTKKLRSKTKLTDNMQKDKTRKINKNTTSKLQKTKKNNKTNNTFNTLKNKIRQTIFF